MKAEVIPAVQAKERRITLVMERNSQIWKLFGRSEQQDPLPGWI